MSMSPKATPDKATLPDLPFFRFFSPALIQGTENPEGPKIKKIRDFDRY